MIAAAAGSTAVITTAMWPTAAAALAIFVAAASFGWTIGGTDTD